VNVAVELALVWVCSIGLAVGLWPRRPHLAAAAWLGVFVAVVVLLWDHAGLWAAVLGTVAWIHIVRALDAAASNRDLDRGAYLGYVLFTVLVPPSQQVDPPPRSRCWLLVPRGAVLIALAGGLVLLGDSVEPWRVHPYVDDVWFTVEVGVFFTGLVDLTYSVAVFHQLRAPRPHDPLFFAAGSLREFWSARWNNMFGRSLQRAVLPLFGRRQVARTALAAFALSAIVHALPALVIHSNRRYCLVLMTMAFLFFVLHGAAVLVERRLGKWSGRRTNRLWLWSVWALTIPLFPGPVGPALGLHGRPAGDLTLFHLAPGLRQLVGL
jgi:Membrane bound O-acyl transferase family